MSDNTLARIRANPKYLELRQRRGRFGALLSVLMLVVYYGFIALVAFDKPFLGTPIGDGVTTIGIPIGMGVIVFTILITGVYVRRANTAFDALNEELLREAGK